MDLLTGYGSDASDGTEPSPTSRSLPVVSTAPVVPGTGLLTEAAPRGIPSGSGGLLSKLPPPSTAGISSSKPIPGTDEPLPGPARPPRSQQADDDDIPAPSNGSLWSKLPAPAISGKRVVQLQLPVHKALLFKDEDEDDYRPAKRAKPAATKSKLMDFLPAPKHEAPTVLGGGGLGSSLLGAGTASKSRSMPSAPISAGFYDEEDSREPILGPHQPAASGHNIAQASEPAQQHYYQYASGMEQYTEYPTTASTDYGAYGSGYSVDWYGTAQQDTGQEADLLTAALNAEREKALKKGKGDVDLSSIKFVEIDQKQLTYMEPSKKESANSLQNALGEGFVGAMRAEAGKHLGSRLARRKHQIGTLYANAKLQEIQLMESRAQSMKTKKETQAKYGW